MSEELLCHPSVMRAMKCSERHYGTDNLCDTFVRMTIICCWVSTDGDGSDFVVVGIRGDDEVDDNYDVSVDSRIDKLQNSMKVLRFSVVVEFDIHTLIVYTV